MAEEVKIKEFKGEIVAQIPYSLIDKVRELKLGRWEPRWKCWRFPFGAFAANKLYQTFKPHLTLFDDTLKELVQDFENAHKYKAGEAVASDSIPGLKSKLWLHQAIAYAFASNIPAAPLICDMGTGKSLMAIATTLSREHDMTLIVCPKSVLDVWPSEFDKHVSKQFRVSAPRKGTCRKRVSNAKKDLEIAKATKTPFALLVNYESFWRADFLKFITSHEWNMIIYDEIHRLKDPSGKAAKAAHKLVDYSTYRLGLTGTVMPHTFMDVFSQYKALDPSVFGKSFTSFRKKYAEMGGFGGKEVLGPKNEEELHEKIHSIAVQIGNEVLDLPDAVHTRRYCELSDTTRSVYSKLDSALYAEVEEGEITVANAMVKVLRLQQLTSGHLKDDDGEVFEYGGEKRALLDEILQEINKDEPVVIFCRFVHDITNIKKVCAHQGRSCAELSGSANQLKQWQNGEYNVLAANVRSGKEGIDLTRAAYCLYYSIGHSLGDYEQSLKRTHRPGQTRTVRYYHLLAKDTVDEKVYAALKDRKEVVEYIMNGIKEGARNGR